ncbi:MAG: hypothetical protein COB38_02855 [Gammaproteobacteria bacterium]|nr:MAG: hypothetical protein COB38_02855 [Gammaproteobacteria bacterium]
MGVKFKKFTAKELDKFKQFQQQSYKTLEEIKSKLEVGMTEIQVARMLRKSFHQQGVHSYFHVPVVLFAERTGYPGDFGQFEALATDKRLEDGMAIILDAAPIYEGYIVDTSLATHFGENREQEQLHSHLEKFRIRVLEMVKQRETFSDIEKEMDQMIKDLGGENCHRKHIGEVLGHRIFRERNPLWKPFKIKQLSFKHVFWLFWKSIATKKGWMNQSPNWNHRKTSAHKPFEGLWAVEPHFAVNGIGVKFEEIMVITKEDAYWLDDDLPHIKMWQN